MEKKKAEIKALAIAIGEVEVSITIEQAKQLYGALHEMFGSKTVVAPGYPLGRPYPFDWWPWSRPYWYSSCGSISGSTLGGSTSNIADLKYRVRDSGGIGLTNLLAKDEN